LSEERRHQPRLALTMPVRVAGFGADGQPWTEMSTVKDLTASGAAFLLKHPVTRGHVLHLSLPLPKRFRSYDLGDASYHVYVLVRSAHPQPPGARVGVMFLGKHPPRGFDKEPAGLYLLPNDPPPARMRDRRVGTRLEVFVNVRLTRREGVDGPQDERTIAENIGRNGARVMSALPVEAGEILLLTEIDGDFETRVQVRGLYVGPDKIPRLNLHFLDCEAPDRLVPTNLKPDA
jgi:PilZ domain